MLHKLLEVSIVAVSQDENKSVSWAVTRISHLISQNGNKSCIVTFYYCNRTILQFYSYKSKLHVQKTYRFISQRPVHYSTLITQLISSRRLFINIYVQAITRTQIIQGLNFQEVCVLKYMSWLIGSLCMQKLVSFSPV